MTTPRPELFPERTTIVSWALTPETYSDSSVGWRQWGEGPWQDEPDRIEWRSPHSALPRMAIRNNFGAWCGYVGVSEGHPLFGKGHDDPEIEAAEVHGGVTYARACEDRLCHVPLPGESDRVWWFGFDCAHCYDYAPGLVLGFTEGLVYRDAAYVIAETERLAAQCEGPR